MPTTRVCGPGAGQAVRRTRSILAMEREPDDLDQAEKHVAEEIEAAIDVPASIEAEAMLEAAELEELESAERKEPEAD